MIPGASRPDVTAEALNMLEAYLHFESLNEFESNNGDTATCTDACVAQVDDRNPFGSFQSSAAGFDPSTNSLRRKFAWLDPLNRVKLFIRSFICQLVYTMHQFLFTRSSTLYRVCRVPMNNQIIVAVCAGKM